MTDGRNVCVETDVFFFFFSAFIFYNAFLGHFYYNIKIVRNFKSNFTTWARKF